MKFTSILNRLGLRDPLKVPQVAYAQNGEDLVLVRLLEGQKQGFYVDVGAHHPFRFSNTCLLHQIGWRGINIDAEPGSMAPFRKYRPGDVNIECGVGTHPGKLKYFRFNEPALNTFDAAEAERKNVAPYRITEIVEREIRPLSEILSENLPAGQRIDVLTVDAEGHDLDVLRSNDWNRFAPRFVLAETLGTSLLEIGSCPVASFMRETGYKPVSKVYDTVFFTRD